MSCHLMSSHVGVILPHVGSCCVMSCHVVSWYTMSCGIMSCCIVSCSVGIVSCHVMLDPVRGWPKWSGLRRPSPNGSGCWRVFRTTSSTTRTTSLGWRRGTPGSHVSLPPPPYFSSSDTAKPPYFFVIFLFPSPPITCCCPGPPSFDHVCTCVPFFLIPLQALGLKRVSKRMYTRLLYRTSRRWLSPRVRFFSCLFSLKCGSLSSV